MIMTFKTLLFYPLFALKMRSVKIYASKKKAVLIDDQLTNLQKFLIHSVPRQFIVYYQ